MTQFINLDKITKPTIIQILTKDKQVVLKEILNSLTPKINVSHLPQGQYVFQLISNSHIYTTQFNKN